MFFSNLEINQTHQVPLREQQQKRFCPMFPVVFWVFTYLPMTLALLEQASVACHEQRQHPGQRGERHTLGHGVGMLVSYRT